MLGGKKAIQRKKSRKTNLNDENQEDEELLLKGKINLEDENVLVKTLPDDMKKITQFGNIPSFQHSKPYEFEGQYLPLPLKFKKLHILNTQKPMFDSNLSVRNYNPETVTADDLLTNLKAAIQQQN